MYQVQCTSVRKESLTRKLMKTSWKPLGRSLLLLHSEKWASEFKRGRENIEDNGRFGRPKDATTDENVKVVHILVVCDRRRDLRSIASDAGIRFGAVQSILTDILCISKVLANWVPRMLTDDQKRTRLDISSKKGSKDQESIQSHPIQDTTWKSDNTTI